MPKTLWDASQRANVPTQPQHLGLKNEVIAQAWQEGGQGSQLDWEHPALYAAIYESIL